MDLSYFRFKPAFWMMGRIQQQSSEAQAAFMRLCCKYWIEGCSLSTDDAKRTLGQEIYDILSKDEIIKTNNSHVKIEFLDEQMQKIKDRSLSHSRGAIEAWEGRRNTPQREDFRPPTMREVEKYFEDNGYSTEAARTAYRHYKANNWYDTYGKPIKNWKMKMNKVWFEPKNKAKPKPPKTDGYIS